MFGFARADLDIMLTHDAPAGVRFERHRELPKKQLG